jgi:3-oxosteroid 1-dehydrogenase
MSASSRRKPVVVVGSGAAGLSAALSAATAGADVVVLERAEKIGGTTAYSAGTTWIPANHRAAEIGINDNTESALDYVTRISLGDSNQAIIRTFVMEAAHIGKMLEGTTRLRWRPLPYPDYQSELPGGKAGGRSVEPTPLALSPEIDGLVRNAPTSRTPAIAKTGGTGSADEIARTREEEAMATSGVVGGGRALIAVLAEAALVRGVEIRRNARVTSLRMDGDAVNGVTTADGPIDGQVILATGGFERSHELVRAYLTCEPLAALGAPENEGDGLRMALKAGAHLGNMREAWWCPTFAIPGETFEGRAISRLMLSERARPGSLVIDAAGRRFANEAQSYNDFGRALTDFDPGRYAFSRSRTFMIFDSGYRSRYNIGMLRFDAPDPDWLLRAQSLEYLAAAIDVPPTALAETVQRFNAQAERRKDEDFGRGEALYDRFMGDMTATHASLAPLSTPPFYALPITAGCLGTKGGPRTDDRGRVLGTGGQRIEGLFAAGNVSANCFGLAYPGAGGTIAPALVFGTLAGETAAQA